jgi:hypothetical protein
MAPAPHFYLAVCAAVKVGGIVLGSARKAAAIAVPGLRRSGKKSKGAN